MCNRDRIHKQQFNTCDIRDQWILWILEMTLTMDITKSLTTKKSKYTLKAYQISIVIISKAAETLC